MTKKNSKQRTTKNSSRITSLSRSRRSISRRITLRKPQYATPGWETWRLIPQAKLWELVAVSCDIEPDSLKDFAGIFNEDELFPGHPTVFKQRLKVAKANLRGGQLKSVSVIRGNPSNNEVKLSDFGAWAESIGWKLPKEFPSNQVEIEAKTRVGERWPWGSYETKLLRNLAEAAEKYWKLYDTTDPTTAPTNETVKQWLISEGVPKRVAEVMAQMLRADGLPTGPRK